MMSPGWKKRYHVGVRATQSRKLVAYISAIPAHVRVRQKTILCSEVNFLVVHKKLRGKRLAPVLIKEITRISNLDGIWQGVHTAGIVLPRPVSTARYFHRSLNWQKLYECGFSPLPPGSKPQYQVRKYALPESTSTKGLRAMEEKDLDAVIPLFERYMKRFDMAPEFTKEEMYHWFMPKLESGGEQVVWSYVVEVSNLPPRRRRGFYDEFSDSFFLSFFRTTTRTLQISSPSTASNPRSLRTTSTTCCVSLTCGTTPPNPASDSLTTALPTRLV